MHARKGALLRSIKVDPETNLVERVAHVKVVGFSDLITVPFEQFLTSSIFIGLEIESVLVEDLGTWVKSIAPTQTPKILQKTTQRVRDPEGGGRYSCTTTLRYNSTLDEPYYKIKVGYKVLWVTSKMYNSFFRKPALSP